MEVPSWRGPVNEWLAAHHGVITTAKLRELHCSPWSIAAMVRRGEVASIAPGVYRSMHVAQSDDQLLLAACAINEHALVGFTSAAKHWEFRRVGKHPPRVLLPHGSALSIPGLEVHRCRQIDAIDIVNCGDLRVTSPPRTVFDCADILGADATESNIELLLDKEICTIWLLSQTLLRLGHSRRPGSRTFARVLVSRPAWRSAVETDLEMRVRQALVDAAVPPFESQHWIETPAGHRYRFDFAWPEAKVALEVDHSWWHAGAVSARHDKARDLEVAACGWLTARITEADVAEGLGVALANLATVIAARSAESN